MSLELTVQIECKEFVVNSKPLQILTHLEFQVRAGEFVSLLGPSGCGKTTLLRLIAGLDNSFQGQIKWGGKQLHGPGRDRGMIFQEARLLPWLTVEKNVEFAIPADETKKERKARVHRVLSLVGLLEFAHAWPAQLSGGMAKRVALARALVNIPDLLLLDEPFSGLDSFTKFTLQRELAEIVERERIVALLVTHDIDEAIYLSDRIGIMTRSPSTIKAFYDIPVPRPRSEIFDNSSRAFADKIQRLSHLRSAILGDLWGLVGVRETNDLQHLQSSEPP